MPSPNETPRTELTPAELDQWFARSTERQQRQADAQRQAAEWPGQVDRILAGLAEGMVLLRARVDKLEAALDSKAG